MHVVAMQIAAGKTLFIGLAVTVLAGVLRYRWGRRRGGAWLTVAAVTGGLLVLVSATPFPLWAYAAWYGALALAVAASECGALRGGRVHGTALLAVALGAVGLALAEAPYLRVRELPFPPDRPVFVIGDSLAMSLETGVPPWPAQWAASSGLQVTALAAGGKRAQGALSDLERIDSRDASVLVEIGGNDVLLGTRVEDFDRHLGALLKDLCLPGRRVAMFELPLPPLHNGFGRVQRRYARQYAITLIPKRCLAGILADPGATVDGIHLSPAGHARLAALLTDLTR